MKQTILITFVLAIAFSVTGTEISIHDGVKFNLPDDFISAPKPSNQPSTSKSSSKYIKKNTKRDISISYSIKPSHGTNLEGIKKSFSDAIPLNPDLDCKQNEIIELNGMKWMYLEVSHSKTIDVRNIMMVTISDGQMITFNFNCTEEQFKENEATFRDCIKSITIES